MAHQSTPLPPEPAPIIETVQIPVAVLPEDLPIGWNVIDSHGVLLGTYPDEISADAYANSHPRFGGVEVTIIETLG